jgi:AcrR family transcriptional regulator
MATPTRKRPLRVDAQRNRDRIIGAAHEAFAELGLEVSMEEIARRANVGAATLYRRFPSKQQLLRAIFDTRLSELEPQIAAGFETADPWEGLLAAMRALLEAQARNMAFVQMLAQAGELTALKSELRARVFDPLGELFARAQASGQVRADLDPHELPVLVRMVATTIGHDGRCPAAEVTANWPRYLSLLADALRTPDPAVLPPR